MIICKSYPFILQKRNRLETCFNEYVDSMALYILKEALKSIENPTQNKWIQRKHLR
jgi:hypothetical protein